MFDGAHLWKMKDDNSGIEFAYADDIITAYNDLFVKIFPNINLEASTPQGQIISFLAEIDTKTINTIQDLANYFFLGGSNSLLDIWAYNQYRAVRKKAINGNVLVKIQGEPLSTVKKGFLISDGKLQYELNNDITLNEEGVANEIFKASTVTADISLQGTISQIITPLANVERVINEVASIPGTIVESDSDFYQRCLRYGSLFKNSSFASILANVAQVAGVSKIGGFENATSEAVVERGYSLVKNSFVIIVLGGNDRDIAQTIASCKPPGSAMNGNQEVTLEVNGKKITYKFERPRLVELQVNIQCLLNLNSPHTYMDIAKEAVINYINSLEIGALITQPNLSKYVVSYVSGFEIIDVKIAKKSSALSYSSIQLNLNELATIINSDIMVGATQ